MISEVKEYQQGYPCLKINPITKTIVFFHSKREGITVNKTDSNEIGDHSSSWDESKFVNYHGHVKLSNY